MTWMIPSDMKDTLFPEWNAPVYPAWIDNMKSGEKTFFVTRWHMSPGPIAEAQADGLHQIVPVVALFGKRPAELRKELGKAVWREIHHASETTNARRARLAHKFRGVAEWPQIVQIRPCHLSKCLSSNTWTALLYAGKNAEPRQFTKVHSIYFDLIRMGVEINDEWSVARLTREHDAAALRAAMEKSNPEPWAPAFEFEANGYRFERLISDRDLSHEGFGMRHCIASYNREAKEQAVAIFRVTGADRATYAFGLSGRWRGWSEIEGFGNSKVSKQCHAAAEKCHAAFVSAKGRQS